MENDTTNPYATPEAQLEKPVVPQDGITAFERFSAWWVFLLLFVTLGIYAVFWLVARTRTFNDLFPDDRISGRFIGLTLGLYVLNLMLGVVDEVASGPIGGSLQTHDIYTVFSMVVYLVSVGLLIVWPFRLRRRLNDLNAAHSGLSPLYVGPILTFFFSTIYLQYKINQSLDHHQALQAQAASVND